MSRHCLFVEYELCVPSEVWMSRCEAALPALSLVSGLEWKLWLLDPAAQRGGGVYLFADASAAREFASGPFVASMRASSDLRDLRIRTMPIAESLTAATFQLAEKGARHVRLG